MIDPRIRLLIADDHELYREGLKSALRNCKTAYIAGEAANGTELVDFCGRISPDVILTDISMPGMSGIEATSIINEKFPAVRVIALSMSIENDWVLEMLNAGASGYLIKNADRSEILKAIDTVYKNIPYYCKTTSAKLARLIGQNARNMNSNPVACFSKRELIIIRMICEEKTSKEIADELHLSSRTVEEYRIRIKEKMDVKGTTGIVIYAIQNKLFEVQPGCQYSGHSY